MVTSVPVDVEGLTHVMDNVKRSPPCNPALHALSTPDVAHHILSFASAGTLCVIEKLCRATRDAVLSYKARVFDIAQLLAHWFDSSSSIAAFRALQASTGTLISGSGALAFFDRRAPFQSAGSDLDLYLHRGREREVGAFLLEQGYTFVPRPKQAKDFGVQDAGAYRDDPRPADYPGVKNMMSVGREMAISWGAYRDGQGGSGGILVYTFVKDEPALEQDQPQDEAMDLDGDAAQESLPTKTKTKKIQLMVSRHSPMACVLSFHSTCVMNIIAWDRAYSLYPRATLEQRTALILPRGRDTTLEPAIEKYRQRGWTMLEECADKGELGDADTFAVGSRWIDDAHAWVLPLSPLTSEGKSILAPSSPFSQPLDRDPVATTNWMLLALDTPYIAYSILSGYPFRYDYVLSELEALAFLHHKLWRQVLSSYGHAKSDLSKEQLYAVRVLYDADIPPAIAAYRARMAREKRKPVLRHMAVADLDTDPDLNRPGSKLKVHEFTWQKWTEGISAGVMLKPEEARFEPDFDAIKRRALWEPFL